MLREEALTLTHRDGHSTVDALKDVSILQAKSAQRRTA